MSCVSLSNIKKCLSFTVPRQCFCGRETTTGCLVSAPSCQRFLPYFKIFLVDRVGPIFLESDHDRHCLLFGDSPTLPDIFCLQTCNSEKISPQVTYTPLFPNQNKTDTLGVVDSVSSSPRDLPSGPEDFVRRPDRVSVSQ